MSLSPPHRISRRLKLCVALGATTLLAMSETAVAQTAATAPSQAAASQRYALEAAPLAQTLEAIAKTSGRRVAFESSLLGDRMSAPVSGALTARQAVEMAVAGTGLVVLEDGDGLLKIGAQDLGRVNVIAKRDQAETSFKADRSDTATRSGTNLMEVPQSMTIITSKVLETQQALSVRDALAEVSGVAFTQSPQGSPRVSIRGFSTTTATVNGVTDGSATLTNVFGVERIEVLKGPQAILAGANALGGGVNIVIKKPQADPLRSLLLQYGSHRDLTAAGDLTGAVTDDKRLTYRLIAAKSQAGSSVAGFNGRSDDSLLPELRWKDENTDLIVGLSYGKQYQPPPLYTFARRDGLILPVPALRQGNPDDGFDSRQKRAFYQLDQTLTSHISLISRLEASSTHLYLHLYSPSGLSYAKGAANDSPSSLLTYYAGRSTQDVRTTSGDHYLRIEAETGPVAHKLSLGLNHTNYDYVQTQWSGTSVSPSVYPADATFSFPDLESRAATLSSIDHEVANQAGVYAQDLMSWGQWNLLVNLRRTRYISEGQVTTVTSNTVRVNPEARIWSTTPGAGLIYNLTPGASLYASYSQGFVPQNAALCGGGLVAPITTRNKEVGAKFELMGSELALTVAAFELAQSNSLIYDSINKCYNVRNSQRTRGLEADLQGQLSPGWSIVGNYTYNTVHDATNSATIYAGLARNKMSLWTVYDMQNESWKGWGIGLGLSVSSSVNGSTDARYPFSVPGQTQFDTSLFYRRDKWSVILGVKNVTDKLLYGVSTSSAYVPVLERRNFLLTVKRDFN